MKKVINMIDSSSKVAEVSLLELKKKENELGAIFPDEYKELFLETNGSKFGDWILFPNPTNLALIKEGSAKRWIVKRLCRNWKR